MNGEATSRFGWRPGADERDARRALCRLGRHLYRRGLVAGSAGNISLRVAEDALLVTARGLHKGFMRPSEPVLLGLARPEGDAVRRASTELPLHLAAHRAVPEPMVVLHTHAPALTALGMRPPVGSQGRGVPGARATAGVAGLPPELEAAVGPVARVAFHPSGSEGLGEAVGAAVRGGARLVLLEHHGVVSVGRTIEEALDRTELAELGARAALLAT